MNTRLSTPSLPNRHAHSQDNARPEIHAHTKKRSTCKHNFLSQQCQSAVSFIGVPGYYTTWTNSSYSFLISTIRTVSHNFSVLYLLHMSSAFKVGEKKFKKAKKKIKHDICLKKKIKVCGHPASARYMVSHFTEQLEQMNHQAVPQVFKSILAHRHSVSCLICVVHLSRHVKKYVMWKVYLLKCASLIMVFPSISVSPPTPFTLPPPPSHEDPTSLGRDVLPLKLHGEFCFCPPWLPQQHATVYTATAHLLYLSFVSWCIFNTFRKVCAVIPRGSLQSGVWLIFSSFFVPFFGCVFCKPFNFSVYVEFLL